MSTHGTEVDEVDCSKVVVVIVSLVDNTVSRCHERVFKRVARLRYARSKRCTN